MNKILTEIYCALNMKVLFIMSYREETSEKRFSGMIKIVVCLRKYLEKCLQDFQLTSLLMYSWAITIIYCSGLTDQIFQNAYSGWELPIHDGLT